MEELPKDVAKAEVSPKNESPKETPLEVHTTEVGAPKEVENQAPPKLTEEAVKFCEDPQSETPGSSEEKDSPQNEFSYLQRNEFTSEIYKIEIRNLGWFGIGELKKLLKTKLSLDTSKIKSPKQRDFAFACFRSLEDQSRAIATLNGYKWKGRTLKASVATASADPLMKRRNDDAGEAAEAPKKQRTSADATCPLANLPYAEQLAQKREQMEVLLAKYTTALKRINRDAGEHLARFEFKGVEASPLVDGYRNKNEFTVGKNAEGEIIVGFRLGAYCDGSVEVSAVANLPHIPEAAKWAAKSFQDFVRASRFLPFNPESNSGHFRQVMVRTSRETGEIMIVPGIYSSNLTEEELVELKDALKAFYESYCDSEFNFRCSSLYYQDVKHREAGQCVYPVEHLSGATYITDSILGLRFRISPLAFFQINTRSADVLYQRAIDLASPKAHSIVLDICCGTGTIACAFARHCRRVLGVEIIPEAIKDAEANAALNQIDNCTFFAGNSDDFIQSMVRGVVYDNPPGKPLDLVAVVDPPRAGLHNRSVTAIRAASAIERLVYISCDPGRAQKNWLELGRPQSKQYKGNPFFPRTAVAVDMFPHTSHTEMIVLFERQSAQAGKVAAAIEVEPQAVDAAEVVDEQT